MNNTSAIVLAIHLPVVVVDSGVVVLKIVVVVVVVGAVIVEKVYSYLCGIVSKSII
jgi:hypothetical protein